MYPEVARQFCGADEPPVLPLCLRGMGTDDPIEALRRANGRRHYAQTGDPRAYRIGWPQGGAA